MPYRVAEPVVVADDALPDFTLSYCTGCGAAPIKLRPRACVGLRYVLDVDRARAVSMPGMAISESNSACGEDREHVHVVCLSCGFDARLATEQRTKMRRRERRQDWGSRMARWAMTLVWAVVLSTVVFPCTLETVAEDPGAIWFCLVFASAVGYSLGKIAGRRRSTDPSAVDEDDDRIRA